MLSQEKHRTPLGDTSVMRAVSVRPLVVPARGDLTGPHSERRSRWLRPSSSPAIRAAARARGSDGRVDVTRLLERKMVDVGEELARKAYSPIDVRVDLKGLSPTASG